MAHNGPARERWSIYTVPDGATGEDRVYGTFEHQRILGYACTIQVERVADNDPAVCDMLGQPLVMRGDAAAHISGLDPYGKRTGPGFIRAIGRITTTFEREDVQAHPPSGTGCREPKVGLIVTWDHDAAGNGHRTPELWQHHIFYSPVDYWITLRGLAVWWRQGNRDRWSKRKGFGPRDVCEAIDRIQNRAGCMTLTGDKQHEGAVRRLLETHIGVSNNRIEPRATLQRHGRWTYYFERA